MFLRVVKLLVGLILFGVGTALTVRAEIGLDPWTVLAQGIALRTGIGIGWVVVAIGALVLLAWIPLRQKPGVGTVANILVVGTAMQAALAVLPTVTGFGWQLLVFCGGVVMIAIASGMYIGARMGPGPRDGLMTGLNTRLGWPIWVARFSVEATVLVIGWLLGGTVGIGTVLFAVSIGPLVHLALPLFGGTRRATRRRTRDVGTATSPAA